MGILRCTLVDWLGRGLGGAVGVALTLVRHWCQSGRSRAWLAPANFVLLITVQ